MSEGSTTKLAPCPFCGATDLLQTDKMVPEYCDEAAAALARDGFDDEAAEEWFVVCGSCGVMGPMSPSAEQARTAWNKRV